MRHRQRSILYLMALPLLLAACGERPCAAPVRAEPASFIPLPTLPRVPAPTPPPANIERSRIVWPSIKGWPDPGFVCHLPGDPPSPSSPPRAVDRRFDRLATRIEAAREQITDPGLRAEFEEKVVRKFSLLRQKRARGGNTERSETLRTLRRWFSAGEYGKVVERYRMLDAERERCGVAKEQIPDWDRIAALGEGAAGRTR